ncbi:hypothetical protein D5018_15625 [Parashewanella curva]|uniref:Uncharacterized protein n=1 Tax=Parashewanella curva TaxID=2338552 RepID=A0A3L8PTN9_9GAMM|nr:hypothetical protein [Parashewanella curva]RLV58775.1 hypothetical protein D5018_15625 [Parashewanella curva]
MNNNRFFILSMLLAMSSMQVESQPLKPSIPINISSNFINIKTGYKYCIKADPHNPSLKACMPIYNANRHAYLNIKVQGNNELIAISPKNAYPIYSQSKIDSINVVVTNAEANQVIYSGPVLDKVGITCDYIRCYPWE